MVECRSPKPKVGGSNPSAPAIYKLYCYQILRDILKITEFANQVVKETKKISWSSRKETSFSVMLVFGMVVVASLFFLLVDMTMYKVVKFLLNLGVN